MNKFPLRMIFLQKRFNYTDTSEYRVYRNMLITTKHKIEKEQNIKKEKEQNIENIENIKKKIKEQNIENRKKEIKQQLENRKKKKENIIDIFTYL